MRAEQMSDLLNLTDSSQGRIDPQFKDDNANFVSQLLVAAPKVKSLEVSVSVGPVDLPFAQAHPRLAQMETAHL